MALPLPSSVPLPSPRGPPDGVPSRRLRSTMAHDPVSRHTALRARATKGPRILDHEYPTSCGGVCGQGGAALIERLGRRRVGQRPKLISVTAMVSVVVSVVW